MKRNINPDYSDEFDWGYDKGWEECKREVLKILEQDWTGLDMSVNACDKHYIDRIKKEL